MLLSTLAVSLSLIEDDIMHGSLSAGFIQIKRLIKGYKVINSFFLFLYIKGKKKHHQTINQCERKSGSLTLVYIHQYIWYIHLK